MFAAAEKSFPNSEYLTATTFQSFHQIANASFPELCGLLDETAITPDKIDDYAKEMNSISWEFESSEDGGRGLSYNVAQKAVENNPTCEIVMQSSCYLHTRDCQRPTARICATARVEQRAGVQLC